VTVSDDRTTATGLFNTARSYWRSAEELDALQVEVSHREAPVTFLFCHAIELYLKAFLRGAGKTIADLKKVGHRVADLAALATASGLSLEPEHSEILSHIDDTDVAIEARYIVTGFKTRPANEALAQVAGHLDDSVCTALAKEGYAVRSEAFTAPNPKASNELDQDTARLLVQLFRADDIDHRGVRFMARLFTIDVGMVRYHLDQLKVLGFARLGSAGREDAYWFITPEGRRYVVERKLIDR
jgi:hypothetical protein